MSHGLFFLHYPSIFQMKSSVIHPVWLLWWLVGHRLLKTCFFYLKSFISGFLNYYIPSKSIQTIAQNSLLISASILLSLLQALILFFNLWEKFLSPNHLFWYVPLSYWMLGMEFTFPAIHKAAGASLLSETELVLIAFLFCFVLFD